jgi:hypothetical protein
MEDPSQGEGAAIEVPVGREHIGSGSQALRATLAGVLGHPWICQCRSRHGGATRDARGGAKQEEESDDMRHATHIVSSRTHTHVVLSAEHAGAEPRGGDVALTGFLGVERLISSFVP